MKHNAIDGCGLSAAALKYLGCLFMLADHLGMLLFPHLASLRCIGRLAFPIFAFMIANGFRHTSNAKKYLLRLAAFALGFQWFYRRMVDAEMINIFATLALGLVSLMLAGWLEQNLRNKYFARTLGLFLAAVCAYLGQLLHVEYGWYGVALIYTARLFFDQQRLLAGSWLALNIAAALPIRNGQISMQVFSLLALPLIFLYNGRQGHGGRWFFYLFYCLHLTALYLLKIWLL